MTNLLDFCEEFSVKEEMKMVEEQLCRLCTEKTLEYSSIFTNNLHEVLKTTFGVLVEEMDNWPKNICKSCMCTIQICLNFIATVRTSETKLRDLFGDWRNVKAEISAEIDEMNIKVNPLEEESTDEDVSIAKRISQRRRKENVSCTPPARVTKKKRGRPRKQTILTQVKSEEDSAESAPSQSPIFMDTLKNYWLSPETAETETTEEKDLMGIANKSLEDISKANIKMKKSCEKEKKGSFGNQISKENTEKIEEFFKMDCELCQEPLTKLKDLQEHFRQVHNMKAYLRCCNIKFNRPFKILDHLKLHLNPEAFKCSECGKSFKNNAGLRLHLENSHTPMELHKFKCPHCTKSFMNIHRYRNHLAVHVKESDKRYICPHCGKAFALRAHMKIHIKGMHEEVTYHICEICAKMFKNKDVFRRHQKTHTGEKIEKIPCPICGRLFNYNSKLKLHIARHNVDKEVFQCHICNKISPNKQALQGHIKFVHVRQRTHKCTLCSAAFKTAQRLKEHIATHTSNQILYTCLFCPKTFNSSANKYSHQKRQHPVEYEEMQEKRTIERLQK